MGTVSCLLGFTDRQVCVALCQSLSLFAAGVRLQRSNGAVVECKRWRGASLFWADDHVYVVTALTPARWNFCARGGRV